MAVEPQYVSIPVVEFESLMERGKRCEEALSALRAIREIQPRTLQALQEAGVVFDETPREMKPKEWQQIAFWIYTALCEADLTAQGALGG